MNSIHLKRPRLASVTLAAWVTLALPASAALVTLHGSFLSFEGAVAYPPGSAGHTEFGPSYINNVQVNPTTPTARPGVGLGSLTLGPGTTTVVFHNAEETRNLLAFTPAPQQSVSSGDNLFIGTFILENGSWFGGLGEGDAMFSFQAWTVSDDPALNGHVFTDVIRYHVTQFAVGNTPQDNADVFSFVGRSDLGGMSVYEMSDSPTGSNRGSIDLYGRIGSLIPTRFDNAQGGAFIAAVPEPSSCLATALLLGVFGGAMRLRHRANSRSN